MENQIGFLTEQTIWKTNIHYLQNTHKKTRGTKKQIMDYLYQLYCRNRVENLSNITVSAGRHVDLQKMTQILDTKVVIPDNLNLEIIVGPYIFHHNHAYENFANKDLGGGVLASESGFVQEEKITIISSLLLPLIGSDHALPLEDTNLYDQPMIMNQVTIMVHETNPSELYGQAGIRKIKQNPNLIKQNYLLHPAMPEIIWICKSIPPMRNNDHYMTKNHNKIPVDIWALLLSIEANLSTIQIMDKNPDIKSISIHGGNWGCGAFGHNLNTMFMIEHLAIIAAVRIYQPTKQVTYHYHTYDESSNTKLLNGQQLLHKIIHSDLSYSVDQVMSHIRNYHQQNIPEWCIQL